MNIHRFARGAASAAIAASLLSGVVAAAQPRVETAFFEATDDRHMHVIAAARFRRSPKAAHGGLLPRRR